MPLALSLGSALSEKGVGYVVKALLLLASLLIHWCAHLPCDLVRRQSAYPNLLLASH